MLRKKWGESRVSWELTNWSSSLSRCYRCRQCDISIMALSLKIHSYGIRISLASTEKGNSIHHRGLNFLLRVSTTENSFWIPPFERFFSHTWRFFFISFIFAFSNFPFAAPNQFCLTQTNLINLLLEMAQAFKKIYFLFPNIKFRAADSTQSIAINVSW